MCERAAQGQFRSFAGHHHNRWRESRISVDKGVFQQNLSNSLHPPVYKHRALKLLADCEYRLKVRQAVRREQALLAIRSRSFADPLQTKYAEAYRLLIRFCETNHIRLVLADYSMAANEDTPRRIIDFYRARVPAIVLWIKANQIHTMIVRQLAQQHPEVVFVDTHPDLDGDHDKFIDLMHFTQAGRRQLADTLFAGMRETLERDLISVRSGSSPKSEDRGPKEGRNPKSRIHGLPSEAKS